jgi:hypothetical protein
MLGIKDSTFDIRNCFWESEVDDQREPNLAYSDRVSGSTALENDHSGETLVK